MRPFQRAKGRDGPDLCIVVSGQILLAGAHGGAVIDDDGDVDAEDGENGTHVEVHEEDALGKRRRKGEVG